MSGRIFNGDETQPHAFPSIVRMRMSKSRNEHCGTKANQHCGFCGGTIINSQWILTAGHCCYRTGRNLKERACKVPLTILPQTVSFAIGAHYDDTCDHSHQCGSYPGVNGDVTGYVVNATQIVIHPQFQAGTKVEKGTYKYDFCLVKIKENQTIKFEEVVKKVELAGTDFDLVIYYL